MGDYKMTCPVCGAHTNSVGLALANGEPCPHCGTPAETTREILATRERLGDKTLKARVEELLAENGRMRVERDRLRDVVGGVKAALEADEEPTS